MYAIIVVLNYEKLEKLCPMKSFYLAHEEIRRFLEPYGFVQKGTFYVANKTLDEVKIVIAVNAMSNELEWLKHCVNDIRVLRNYEISDLRFCKLN